MSDDGNVNGEVIDSPTVNSYVVGVSIVEGETDPRPTTKGKTVTPTDPDPAEPDPEPEPSHRHDCDTSVVTPPRCCRLVRPRGDDGRRVAILRLTDADVDADRIAAMIPAAARVDRHRTRPARGGRRPPRHPSSASAQPVDERVETIEPQPAGAFTVAARPGRLGAGLIRAHKQRWGIA